MTLIFNVIRKSSKIIFQKDSKMQGYKGVE